MEITRETDYAVRCVLYLSESPEEVKMVDEISKAKVIPKSFLAKILQKLAKADIVRSYRGVKGGFQLAKNPDHISLLDVIEAIDGPVAMNVCALDKKACSLSNSCVVHPVWIDLRKTVETYLKGYSFARLIRESKK
jgi:Rrf2 family protein